MRIVGDSSRYARTGVDRCARLLAVHSDHPKATMPLRRQNAQVHPSIGVIEGG